MESKMKHITDALSAYNITFRENEDVTMRSSFKVGGIAALAVFPDSIEKLVAALRILNKGKMRFEVIGNASNILFAFDRFDGALIFTSGISSFEFNGNKVSASCGVSLTYLAEQAARRSCSGLEFAYGIPALVGGAVYMNAGAYGACVSDVLKTSLAYDLKNDCTLEIEDHGFGYRKSIYMQNEDLICLGATFELEEGKESSIREKMTENMRSRKEKQPLEYPSAGSYFKRPPNNFAGKLIEDCGLKGMRVGDAEVSVKHAGFIINRGKATYCDIIELEEKIKEIVMSRYGVLLEREVRLIK